MRQSYFKRLPDGALEVLGHTLQVSAGRSDDVYVYHDRESIYVYAENHGLEYAGLEVFDRADGVEAFSIFIQSDDGSGNREWLLRTSRIPSKIRFLCQWWQ